MIKVRVITGLTAATAAALSIPSLVGCTAPAEDEVGTGSENNTESIAGSGVVSLYGWSLNYQSTSGGDEFVRVGERMKVSLDFNSVVNAVTFDQATRAALRADPSLLKLSAQVRYTKFDGSPLDAPALPVAWEPGAGNLTVGNSAEFVVPKGVKQMSLELAAEFTSAGVPQSVTILERLRIPRDFVVFGAFLPNKLALFDTTGAERRTRVVEGGGVVKGANLTMSVTDWRLDTVVDKSSLDLRVGDTLSGSRFGSIVVPAYGNLEYEVEAVVSTDGGASYQPLAFARVASPPVLSRADGRRFTHEAALQIPADAGPNMKVAFHVKAFLQVPNGNIMNARYAPGSRILLKDVWDNNGGQDYSLPISGE